MLSAVGEFVTGNVWDLIYWSILSVVYVRYGIPLSRRLAIFYRIAPQRWIDDGKARFFLLRGFMQLLDSIVLLFYITIIFLFLFFSIQTFIDGTGYGIGAFEESQFDGQNPTLTVLFYLSGAAIVGKVGWDIVRFIDEKLTEELEAYDLYKPITKFLFGEEE